MKITATGRKVTLKDHFLKTADERLSKLDKLFTQPREAFLKVTVEKNRHTVEITVRSGKLLVRSEKSADTMEQALALAVESLETQIVKNKKKLNRKYTEAPRITLESDDAEPDYEIVRTKVFHLEGQSAEDAILEMNMAGHDFYMFKDIVTGEINVVYRRNDGKYGLLLPQ